MKALVFFAALAFAAPAAAETLTDQEFAERQQRAEIHFQIAENQLVTAGKRCFGPDYSLKTDEHWAAFSEFAETPRAKSNECRDYTTAMDSWIELNLQP